VITSEQPRNQISETSNQLAEDRTDLAYERTALANDRTLIAWVRTSIALISFGFTIYKFFQSLESLDKLKEAGFNISPRGVGMILISLGFFCSLFGLLQYRNDMKRIRGSNVKSKFFSFAPVLAIVISIFSLVLLLSSIYNQ
jgi:putative membrane protein